MSVPVISTHHPSGKKKKEAPAIEAEDEANKDAPAAPQGWAGGRQKAVCITEL